MTDKEKFISGSMSYEERSSFQKNALLIISKNINQKLKYMVSFKLKERNIHAEVKRRQVKRFENQNQTEAQSTHLTQ